MVAFAAVPVTSGTSRVLALVDERAAHYGSGMGAS
jgi:hypothetical protein